MKKARRGNFRGAPCFFKVNLSLLKGETIKEIIKRDHIRDDIRDNKETINSYCRFLIISET